MDVQEESSSSESSASSSEAETSEESSVAEEEPQKVSSVLASRGWKVVCTILMKGSQWADGWLCLTLLYFAI